MAPSPERTSVRDGFFPKGPPVPFRAPLILGRSPQASPPFSLPSSNSGGSRGNRHVRTVKCPFLETPWVLGRGSAAGSLSLLRARSLFSMRAGRELAGLRLPRHHCCGCCCLQCPLVTCSRCSHNSVRGGGGGHPAGWTPFFILWLWVDFLALVCAASFPPEIQQHQATPKWATRLPLHSCVYSLPVQGFYKACFAIQSTCECWFKRSSH